MQEITKQFQLGAKKKTKQSKWGRFRRHFLQGTETWEGRYVCHDCGKHVEKPEIDLHHILHRSVRPDLVFVAENCVAICRRCHNLRHGIRVK